MSYVGRDLSAVFSGLSLPRRESNEGFRGSGLRARRVNVRRRYFVGFKAKPHTPGERPPSADLRIIDSSSATPLYTLFSTTFTNAASPSSHDRAQAERHPRP